ncbi:MAG TPA: AAA family ATPase [Solirubrobacteraceae bacterium]
MSNTLSSNGRGKTALVGRGGECEAVDTLLTRGKGGESAILVLRGAAGTGKTALLDYAADRSDGYRLARVVGVESEMELPFAGLHQLCGALLDRLDRLPSPQRDALATAFGLSTGAPPDRFFIGLAVLHLLSDAAEELPLLCLVDDAQWLDQSSAQALSFVARRLQAESLALLFAVREPADLDDFSRLPNLRLEGLSDEAARELLASTIGTPLDERVRARILAEARGNPLALLELPRELSPTSMAGGFGLPVELPLQSRIEASFRGRVDQLPDATQQLLLLAAAEPTGEPALLWRSASELGIDIDALDPAVEDGLLELDARVAFRHPLLRSAIYRAASNDERRTAHRALGAATDADADPDRRAWHLARAAMAFDEDVAEELERSAGRAQARGGVAAAAAFLQRAAALTLDPARRATRALQAAEAKQLAGAPQEAMMLLAGAAEGPLSELDRAMLQRLHGQIALDLRRAADAVPLLLDAARRLTALDPDLARRTYLEALRAASVAGRLGGGTLAAAKAARDAPPPSGVPRASDLLLDGLAVRFTEGYSPSAAPLRRALDAVRREGNGDAQDIRWPWIARRVAPDLFDDESWHAIATRNVQIARDTGALAVLPLALNLLSLLSCFEGKLAAAATLIEEADEIAEASGIEPIVFGRILLIACRGDASTGLDVIERLEAAASARDEGVVLTFGEHARALLYNSRAQYLEALGPAQSASSRDELMLSVWSLPELVEAAARSGNPDVAQEAVERLADCTRAAGTNLALGVEARARALVSDHDVAEPLHREAIERLGRCRLALELGRAHLGYGEWLRRDQRRVDARDPLRKANEMFTLMGARALAERARRELQATGENVRARAPEARDRLTAQEAQIAQLARDGLSNPEIAARMFISPRTVQYHLRKVFAKLDISSRNQLPDALPGESTAA